MSTALDSIDSSKREVLLETIRTTGSIPHACLEIGITTRDLTRLRKKSVMLDEMVLDAVEIATADLEVEARRRAVEGVEKGVYFKGELVETEKVYSDTLLRDLLKANNPDKFRERVDVNHTGSVSVNINGYKQFQEMNKLNKAPIEGEVVDR